LTMFVMIKDSLNGGRRINVTNDVTKFLAKFDVNQKVLLKSQADTY
jgi:hypothetical protein